MSGDQDALRKEVLFLESESETFRLRAEDLRRRLGEAPAGPSSTPAPLRGASVTGLEQTIAKLKWTEKTGGYSWAWAKNRDGSDDPTRAPLLEAIKAAPKGELALGDFTYRVSGDTGQFIGRQKKK